jgi:hypothetical protein
LRIYRIFYWVETQSIASLRKTVILNFVVLHPDLNGALAAILGDFLQGVGGESKAHDYAKTPKL